MLFDGFEKRGFTTATARQQAALGVTNPAKESILLGLEESLMVFSPMHLQ